MKFQNPIAYIKSRNPFGARGGIDPTKAAIVCAVLLVLGIALGVIFGSSILRPGVPVRVSKNAEINRLIQKVSRHFVVNTMNDPVVATVQDANSLRQQNPLFYRDVENGDRLIVWENDRAVLYSTKRDLVLAAMMASPSPTGEQANAPDQTAAVQVSPKDLKFEIRNATGKPGSAKTLADRMKSDGYKNVTVTTDSKTYAETTIVKLTDKAKAVTDEKTLTTFVGGTFGAVPAGEKASSADFLIILGTDQS
jgi:hypothetical protein